MRHLAAILAFYCVAFATCNAQEARGLRVSDMFKLENFEYDSFRFSPDGAAVAFGLTRPLDTARSLPAKLPLPTRALEIDNGHSRSDVWLQEAPGRPPRNLTNGLRDGSGWWEPQWSPDGQRLAMLSSRGEEVAVWIWERATGALYELKETRSIDLRALYGVADSTQLNDYIWVDNRRLLCSVSKDRQAPYPSAGLTLPRGTELTASALDSGVPANLDNLAKAQIRLIDVSTQSASELTTETVPPNRGRAHVLSSNRKTLATSKMVGIEQPKANVPIISFEDSDPNYAVELRSFNGDLLRFDRELPNAFVPGSVRWSRSGEKLVFLGYGEGKAPPFRLWLVELDTNRAREVDLGKLRLGSSFEAEWNASDELMFKASSEDKTASPEVKRQDAWWLLTGSSEKRPLSDDERKQSSANISEASARQRFEQSAKKPSERAKLVAFSAEHQTAIYQEDGPNGLFAWRVSLGNRPAELLMKTNLNLAGITSAEFRLVEYVSLNGVPLKGSLMLPVGYKSGRRYPLAVWVYPGDETGNVERYKRAQGISTNRITYDNQPLQLLAAQGYAVLFPSMPLKKVRLEGGKDGPDDPLLKLTDGVLPAVEKVVSLGIADGQRVFVMGHSGGGYTTYGLVTQTNRFRAAVAMNGFSDLTSVYGTFDARKRYMDESHLRQSIIGLMEIGQGAMDNPPWKDLGRYLRNSPITYVDRVETPLLMIHGDLDFVPIQQAEEFFTALYRQGKRAQFVRYWGEEHSVMSSAANVRDMWTRIFAWFDEFGDISRDEHGDMLFEGDRPKSRNGAPALTPADFVRFDQH